MSPLIPMVIEQVSRGERAFDIYSRLNVKRRLEEILAEHTHQPLERVSKDMERDYFMTSDEAREYGIIDQVITHR